MTVSYERLRRRFLGVVFLGGGATLLVWEPAVMEGLELDRPEIPWALGIGYLLYAIGFVIRLTNAPLRGLALFFVVSHAVFALSFYRVGGFLPTLIGYGVIFGLLCSMWVKSVPPPERIIP